MQVVNTGNKRAALSVIAQVLYAISPYHRMRPILPIEVFVYSSFCVNISDISSISDTVSNKKNTQSRKAYWSDVSTYIMERG